MSDSKKGDDNDGQAKQTSPHKKPVTPHRPTPERKQNTPPPPARLTYQNIRPDQTSTRQTKRKRHTNSRRYATRIRDLTRICRSTQYKWLGKTGNYRTTQNRIPPDERGSLPGRGPHRQQNIAHINRYDTEPTRQRRRYRTKWIREIIAPTPRPSYQEIMHYHKTAHSIHTPKPTVHHPESERNTDTHAKTR